MTRKDCIKIAAVLADMKPLDAEPESAVHNEWLDYINGFSNMLQEDNPRFNRSVFEKACGL